MNPPVSITTRALERVADQPELVVRVLPVSLLLAAAFVADAFSPTPDGMGLETVRAAVNIWVQLAIMVVSAIISYALAPKPPEPPKPSLDDITLPTAEEGRPIPVVFGSVWVSGPNVLWYGDLNLEPIKSKGGKK